MSERICEFIILHNISDNEIDAIDYLKKYSQKLIDFLASKYQGIEKEEIKEWLTMFIPREIIRLNNTIEKDEHRILHHQPMLLIITQNSAGWYEQLDLFPMKCGINGDDDEYLFSSGKQMFSFPS